MAQPLPPAVKSCALASLATLFSFAASAQKFEAVGNTDPDHVAAPYALGEVTVTFDLVPGHVRFDLPSWVVQVPGPDGAGLDIQYLDAWVETYDLNTDVSTLAEGQSYEASNDDRNDHEIRYWIESQNDARIVVRYRAAMYHASKGIARDDETTDSPYGKGEWVDEWYTFSPDGTCVRRARVYSNHAAAVDTGYGRDGELTYEMEGLYMYNGSDPSRAGRVVTDDVDEEVLTLINMDGSSTRVDFSPYPGQFPAEFTSSNIHVVNTKATNGYDPFRIGRPTDAYLMTVYQPAPSGGELLTSFPGGNPYYIAGIGQMWYPDQWQQTDRQFTEIWLSGFTNADEGSVGAELSTLARSWHAAPAMSVDGDITGLGFDFGQRAYLVDVGGASEAAATLTIEASTASPLVNPTFLINKWGTSEPSVSVGGSQLTAGDDFRFGYYSTLEIEGQGSWTEVLVVWIDAVATDSTTLEIQGSGAAIPGTGGSTGDPDGSPNEPACQSPLSLCDELCVELGSDPDNCGACAAACDVESVCSEGACLDECAPGLTRCEQACADPSNSLFHCGTCDATCSTGQTCEAGECVGEATGGSLTMPSADTEPVADGGDASGSVGDGSGCGCATVGGDGRSTALPWMVGLLLLGVRALRQRARSRPARP